MNKKIKKQKGITLIALIITIILLLILAIVTISAVNEGNLFAHANNAATKYLNEAELENEKISEWIGKMEQYDNASRDAGEGGSVPASNQSDYTYTKSGNTATITGLSSTGISKIANATTTEFSIPSQIIEEGNTYAVTTIGDRAFLNCTNLEEIMENDADPIYRTDDYDRITRIVIPDTVTNIGEMAFAFSKANINVPNNIENIGAASYAFCENFSIQQLPDSINTIGDAAFIACNMPSFTIQNSLSSKDIDWNDVVGLANLSSSITIDLTNITDFTNLTCANIIIGEHVATIAEDAFKKINYDNYNNDVTITFLGRPTTIDNGAFSDAYGNNTFIVPWTQANKFANEPWGANEGTYVRFKYSDMANGTYYYYKGGE